MGKSGCHDKIAPSGYIVESTAGHKAILHNAQGSNCKTIKFL